MKIKINGKIKNETDIENLKNKGKVIFRHKKFNGVPDYIVGDSQYDIYNMLRNKNKNKTYHILTKISNSGFILTPSSKNSPIFYKWEMNCLI